VIVRTSLCWSIKPRAQAFEITTSFCSTGAQKKLLSEVVTVVQLILRGGRLCVCFVCDIVRSGSSISRIPLAVLLALEEAEKTIAKVSIGTRVRSQGEPGPMRCTKCSGEVIIGRYVDRQWLARCHERKGKGNN